MVKKVKSEEEKTTTGAVSHLVAGQEKFLIMVLGAIAVFVQAYDFCGCAVEAAPATCNATCWFDQNMKNLLTAIIVAAQGWLGTNTGSVQLEPGEVVADKKDVDAGADTKPPSRILSKSVEEEIPVFVEDRHR